MIFGRLRRRLARLVLRGVYLGSARRLSRPLEPVAPEVFADLVARVAPMAAVEEVSVPCGHGAHVLDALLLRHGARPLEVAVEPLGLESGLRVPRVCLLEPLRERSRQLDSEVVQKATEALNVEAFQSSTALFTGFHLFREPFHAFGTRFEVFSWSQVLPLLLEHMETSLAIGAESFNGCDVLRLRRFLLMGEAYLLEPFLSEASLWGSACESRGHQALCHAGSAQGIEFALPSLGARAAHELRLDGSMACGTEGCGAQGCHRWSLGQGALRFIESLRLVAQGMLEGWPGLSSTSTFRSSSSSKSSSCWSIPGT